MELHVNRAALTAFRMRSIRRYPKEYGELLYGHSSKRRVRIVEFLQVPFLNGQAHWWFNPSLLKLKRGRLWFLGSIHSHPDSISCEPSETDWEKAREQPEMYIGVCAVNPQTTPKTRVQFFRGVETLLDFKHV